jgi:hypothetical protein
MKLKHYLVVVALWFCSCYSYSETITDKTSNAAAFGLSWTMTKVLPQYTGLTVNSVNYRYTTVKNTEDPMVVSIQNLHTNGNGYVFRSVDDWTARPGNTITKIVPVDNIPVTSWGRGEITVQGQGSVTDPFVSYGYRYDTCKLEPVTDTSCPNYKLPQTKLPELNSDTLPQFAKYSYDSEEALETNRRFGLTEPKEKKLKDNKSSNSLITAQAAAQAAALEALNNIPDFKLYTVALPGGVYQETIKYRDKVLPDSRNSQRLNLSQQQLHNTMVESQYNLRGPRND